MSVTSGALSPHRPTAAHSAIDQETDETVSLYRCSPRANQNMPGSATASHASDRLQEGLSPSFTPTTAPRRKRQHGLSSCTEESLYPSLDLSPAVPASRPFINPTTRAHVHSLAAAGPVVITRHSPRRQLVHWPPTNDPPSACPRGHHETAVHTEPPATVAQSSRRQQNGTHLDVSIGLGGEPSGWRRGCTTVDDDNVPLPTPHSLLRSLGTNGHPNGHMLGFFRGGGLAACAEHATLGPHSHPTNFHTHEAQHLSLSKYRHSV
ncbi:hypothetical protein V8E53_004362 [Lactarius tabidus]